MFCWQTTDTLDAPSLFGADGELIQVRVNTDPRNLEELLEVLAGLDFPVNPEILHLTGMVSVEFPAYSGQLDEVREKLSEAGLDPFSVQVQKVLSGAFSVVAFSNS